MPHQVQNLLLRSLCRYLSLVSHIARRLPFAAKLPANLDPHPLNLDSAFLRFAVKVIAVAGGQGEEEQLPTVYRRTETQGLTGDGNGLFAAVGGNRGRVLSRSMLNQR